MSYLYETHLHTKFSSACASSKGSEYIKYYKDLGYSGIIVTDHFYNGNTAIPHSLPWKEWVKQFCKGFEEARNEGERQGLDVFFGWEETFDNCDDYLVYGLDKEWLLEHPEAKNWTRGKQYRAVKDAGGCVVQAHPFRQHSYISKITLSTGCVDGAETANGTNHKSQDDALAYRYAQKLGLCITAGSDMHGIQQFSSYGNFGIYIFGIYLKEKMKTIGDFVNAVCKNEISQIKTSDGRCNYYGNEKVTVPVDVRDKNDRSTGKSWKELIY